jgi:hypothetical protein
MAGLKVFDAYVDVTADGTKAAKQAADDFRNSPDADSAGASFGDSLVAGIGPAIAGAAVGMAISEAMTQEMSGARLTAALDLTADESARYGKLAGDLYSQNYGESIDGLNGSIEAVVSSISGMRTASDEEVGAMVAKLDTLANVFEVDVGRAAQVAGQMIETGMATDGANAADLLTAALQRVPKELRGDLLDAVDEYGPAFAAVGIGGEKAMGLLVDASAKGMYGIDKTGDAIKEFGIRSTDMGTASKVAYDIMGKDQEDYTKRLLAGGDTASGAFQEIIDGVLSIKDPAAQSQAALALFGTPLEDLNVTEIPAFVSALGDAGGGLEDVAGAADEMTSTMGGTTAGALQSVLRPLQQIGTDVAAKVLPPLADFLGWLVETPGAMQAVVAVLAFLALAVGAYTVIQWAMNAAMLANPITWIIVGIVALIAAIVMLVANWDTVVAWISEVWGGFVSWITESLSAFAATFAAEWQSLVDQWNALWAAVGAWLAEVWAGILAVVTGATAWLLGIIVGVAAAVSAAWNALWAWVGAALSAAWTWILSIVVGATVWLLGVITGWANQVATNWNTFWGNVAAYASAIWAGITGFISGAVGAIGGAISGFAGRVTGTWNALWNGARAMLGGVWSSIVSSVSAGISGVMGFIRGLQGQVMGALSGAGSWLLGIGRSIIDGLVNGIRGAIGNVKAVLGSVTSMIPDWKGPAELDAVLLKPSGHLIMGGLVDGLEDGEGPLQRTLGRITSEIPDYVPDFSAMPPAPRGGSSRAGGDGSTSNVTHINIERIEIRAEDVAEFNDIVEMLADLDQAARTGVTATK